MEGAGDGPAKRARLSAWPCGLCGEANAPHRRHCATCEHPRFEDGFDAPPAVPEGDKEALLPPALPASPALYFAVWRCTQCGRGEDDQWLECRACRSPRFRRQSFDGGSYFVSRTQIDGAADRSLPRLHWKQLLCAPDGEAPLVALFASGMTDSPDAAAEFARQFFPPSAHAWLVAQDCSMPKEHECHRTLHRTPIEIEIDGVAHGVTHRALFFKPQSGLMHIKLYMFRFEETLRVCICSSNPTIMSWSFQRECFWVQDFPICRHQSGPQTSFGGYLQDILHHLRVSDKCMQTFGLGSKQIAVDFSGARAQLVASIPGTWRVDSGMEQGRFGHLRLRQLIREAGWNPRNNRESQVYIQSGSIGTDLSRSSFFDDFMLSLDGAALADCFDPGAEGSEDDELDHAALNPRHSLDSGQYPSNVNIYFPSKTVGRRNANLYKRNHLKRMADINCLVSNWHSSTYPVQCFRDVERPGVVRGTEGAPFCHSKFYLRIVDHPEEVAARGECVAYLYIGSHNFSKTAWGFRPGANTNLLRCNSLELGVLMTTKSPEEAAQWIARLPFNIDAQRYSPDEFPFSTHQQHRLPKEQPNPDLIKDFVKLGFDQAEAEAALLTCDGSGPRAYELLRRQRALE